MARMRRQHWHQPKGTKLRYAQSFFYVRQALDILMYCNVGLCVCEVIACALELKHLCSLLDACVAVHVWCLHCILCTESSFYTTISDPEWLCAW